MRFDDGEPEPLAERVRDNGPADARRGARLGHRTRIALRREAARIPATIDLGEPDRPRAVTALLLVVVVATMLEFGRFGISPSALQLDGVGGLSLFALARGDWWAVLTANVLHGGVVHLLLNCFVLVLMGRWAEHLLGSVLTLAVIAWSALLSSVGALLVEPAAVTVGASGIAFGLVGAAVAADPRAQTAAGTIARSLMVVNVIGTFAIPGISIGGHLGGLAAGLACGGLLYRRRVSAGHPAGAPRARLAAVAATVAVAVVLGVACWEVMDPTAARSRGGEVAVWLDR